MKTQYARGQAYFESRLSVLNSELAEKLVQQPPPHPAHIDLVRSFIHLCQEGLAELNNLKRLEVRSEDNKSEIAETKIHYNRLKKLTYCIKSS